MGKYETGDYWNGIYKAEELEKKLKEYKGILSPKAMEYLESVLHLEMSVIKKEISDDDRIALSQLSVYNHISRFNLYHGALNLAKNNKRGINYSDGSDSGFHLVSVSSKEGVESRYMYEYHFDRDYIKIHEYIPSAEKRQEEIDRKKYDRNHIYVSGRPSVDWEGKPLVGGPYDFEVSMAINRYEALSNQINELESIKGLTDNDKKVIRLSKKFSDLFLEEYGLTHEDFTKKDVDSKILEKSYVKVPNTVIVYKEIHYI